MIVRRLSNGAGDKREGKKCWVLLNPIALDPPAQPDPATFGLLGHQTQYY